MRKSHSSDQPQLPISEPARNRGLFADHFLQNRLPELPEWDRPEGLQEAFSALLALYRERADLFTEATNESQTERDFIRPALNLLWGERSPGDCYQVQVTIPNVDARRQPDYALFRTAQERDGAEAHKGTADYWRTVPCLADAKRWCASLDKERAADENPSAQIANYLYRAKVRWGILTNGRIWRLYEQDKSRAGGTYFEVDLEAILQREDLDAFRWFYLFFRREAHLPDQAGKTFLDRVFDGSVAYATEVGDSLKEAVYDALRLLMNGFVRAPQNGLDPHDPAALKLVHENCLIVLYRLLFVLYAEDRGLLPCEDDHYQAYSLRTLHREVNKNLRAHLPYLPTAHRLWGQLCDLFSLIDQGFSHENRWIIPAYNGGLFSPEKHPHIAHRPTEGVRRWEIGDSRLAEVIDLLSYRRQRWDEPGSQDIDYTTLAVQHLGSIYEGLLELQPHLAEVPLVEASEKGKPVFKPETEVPAPAKGRSPRRIEAGEVYLATSRGERKATGSYYTPAYIVDYIVEHTIGPLADEAARQAAALAARSQELERKLADRFDPVTREQFDELQRSRLEPYLSLKVLDPAMGSGHFLVGAADFLSMAMATDPSLPAPGGDDEDLQATYKRLIVERCLFGVDLNPLAVELAKLSLWLHTVSQDKALSFLDHHLRHGNSLIGAWLERDLNREPPRFDKRGKRVKGSGAQLVLGFSEALTRRHLGPMLDLLRRISQSPGETAEAEHAKETLYRELERVRDRFRRVANCWLAPFFGAPVSPEQYHEATEALDADEAQWEALQGAEWFAEAQEKADDPGLSFFHWELEFPEAFFGDKGLKAEGERGFDAVVGNPPYGAVNETAVDGFLRDRFASALDILDLYTLFIECSCGLSLAGGNVGLIVPDKWLTLQRCEPVRRSLLQQSGGLHLDLHEAMVFDEATVETMVVCACHVGHSAGASALVRISFDESRGDGAPGRTHAQDAAHFLARPSCRINAYASPARLAVWRRLGDLAAELGTIATIHYGTKTYQVGKGTPAQTRAIVETKPFTSPTRQGPEWQPILHGEDVDRYSLNWHGGRWVLYGEWLAEPRSETPRTGPRLLFRKVFGTTLVGSYFDGDAATNTLLYTVVAPEAHEALKYVLAVACSPLVASYLRDEMTIVDVAFPQIMGNELGLAPIRLIDFAHPTDADAKARLLADCASALDRGDYALPLELAVRALATHALHHGPAGKAELREDPYWATQIATADPDFPGREDFVHDLLAALAQRMMDLNRDKHEKTSEFLTWLEVYAGCEVETLSNKTKLRAFWEHEAGTLVDVLRANKRKLKQDPTTSAFVNTFVREHKQATEALEPILEAIRKTDDLIDEIVYKLYGLTEEEIAVVKGEPNEAGEDTDA